jgi:hypothetical protein
MTAGSASGAWYWCLRHSRVEEGAGACPPDDRLGPYESEAAARNWRDRAEARDDRWEREDREWEGESDR